jgi:hypothetical protein
MTNHLRTYLLAGLGVALVVGIGAASPGWVDAPRVEAARATGETELPPIPVVKEPADTPAAIKDAYTFAATHPEVLQYIRCYCVCGQRYHHRSNEDCFVKPRRGKGGAIVWNRHAAECSVCLSVALEARRLYLLGTSISDIRAQIDRDYAPKFGHHTDTPAPPEETLHSN